MAENKQRKKLIHLHTPNVKVPQDLLDLGEIAVQHNNEEPALYIRKNNNEIAKFIDATAVDTKIALEKVRAEGAESALTIQIETLTSAVTGNEKVVAAALNQIVESVGLDENGNSPLPKNISLADAVSALSGSSHAHANKNVLDGITAEKVAAWEAAEANASAYTDSAITALNLAETYAKKEVETKISTLIGEDKDKSIRSVAAEEVAKIVDSADTRYDTLKEIADWIINDTTGSAQMANDISALKAISADTRLVKLEGKSHSHSNKDLLDTYTQTEANLADAVAKKHEHTNKAVLDGITEEKVTAWDGALEAAKAYTDEKLIKIDCGEY